MNPATDRFRLAVEVALGDFQHPTPVEVDVRVGECGDNGEGGDGGDDLVWVAFDGGSAGLWVDEEPSDAHLLVRAADFLQDQVFDQLEQTWGEARPPCPGHHHPAHPELPDGEAWWLCLCTKKPIAPIGRLRDAVSDGARRGAAGR